MRRIHLATAALCVAACIGGAAPAAMAAPGNKAPAVSAPASTTKPPAGYVRVGSGVFTASSGVQAGGSVKCPGKKVPLGGGVTIASDDLNTNINSSYPSGHLWVADVNNGSASTVGFSVYAICANKPAGYQVVHSAAATNAAGVQSGAGARCPGAKVPWSGGFFSTSGNVAVNVNSSYPTGDTSHTWQVDMNNASASDAGFFAYAVCANKPHLYGQSFGTGTSNPFSEDNAFGTCGQGQVVVGGGAFSSSASVFVNLNSTEPYTSTTWRTWVNDNTGTTYSFLAYATCVGI